MNLHLHYPPFPLLKWFFSARIAVIIMIMDSEKSDLEKITSILQDAENSDSDIEDGKVIDRDGDEITLGNEGLEE